MRSDAVLTVRRRDLLRAAFAMVLLFAAWILIPATQAQNVQEGYDDKFNVVKENGVGIAVRADGRYVFVAGEKGVLVSDDFGKTGTWVQTLRLK